MAYLHAVLCLALQGNTNLVVYTRMQKHMSSLENRQTSKIHATNHSLLNYTRTFSACISIKRINMSTTDV